MSMSCRIQDLVRSVRSLDLLHPISIAEIHAVGSELSLGQVLDSDS